MTPKRALKALWDRHDELLATSRYNQTIDPAESFRIFRETAEVISQSAAILEESYSLLNRANHLLERATKYAENETSSTPGRRQESHSIDWDTSENARAAKAEMQRVRHSDP